MPSQQSTTPLPLMIQQKNKPDITLFYNKNKVGVDVVDQMVRKYSTHSTSRRWPVAIWCNILNIAALNAWIMYKKATGKTISQKNFILQLNEEQRAEYVRRRKKARPITGSCNTHMSLKKDENAQKHGALTQLQQFAENVKVLPAESVQLKTAEKFGCCANNARQISSDNFLQCAHDYS